MMEKATNATLVAHPRAGRHLVNPAKLWHGAGAVYGADLPKLFGFMLPVPERRVLIRHHQETLDIGRRTLTFFDSPGHAKHHFTILDPIEHALYAGDAVGVRYVRGFTGWDFEFVMPSTSPIDFDPVAVHRTLSMLEQVPFDTVYHAHFGASPKDYAIAETRRCADAFADLIGQLYRPDIAQAEIIETLRNWIAADLRRQGHEPGELAVLDIDVVLDAMGLIHFQSQQNRRRQDGQQAASSQ